MNSICIATYNGEKYLRQQIESILNQISQDDEVIISDDGSTDKTIDIVNSFKDSRIKLLRNSGRHGCIGNFQNALQEAKGDYIFLSDQDDIWLENKYSVLTKYLKDYDLVHHNSIIVDENLNVLKDSFYDLYKNGKGLIKNIKKSTYFGSHMAFERSLLNYVLPFPKTNEIGHDLWIGLVAEKKKFKVLFCDDKLIYYRRHMDAHCSLFEKSNRSIFVKIRGRILMIFNLLKVK